MPPPAPRSAEWSEWVSAVVYRAEPRTWHLDTATYRMWCATVRRWDALARSADTGAAAAGAAGKGDRQFLRVAVILAELAEPGRGGPIPPEAMAGAVALVDYAIGVWTALGGAAETLTTSRREATLLSAADRLAEYVAEYGGRLTRRQVLRTAAVGIRKAAHLDEVLAE